jgi:YVTN family beta-propeller protein
MISFNLVSWCLGGKRSFCAKGLALCLLTCASLACRRQHPLNPYVAYVVNQQSATLAAVNLADFHVTASLPVSPQPEHVLVRPRARQLYVVSAPGKIAVAAFPHLRLVTMLDIGGSARDLQFSPDGRAAYVLNPAEHEVVFLDCRGAAGDHPESAVPKVVFRLRLAGTLRDLALSPDGKTLVAASEKPNQITFISTETRQALGTTEVGESPGPMVILPDNSKVFVADSGEEKISAAALASQKLFSHIEIGTRPTALLLKPDGGEIFVLAAQSSTLVIMDAFHDNVERTFPLGGNPMAGVFRQDMSVLYIANAGDGSVLALDVQTREVLASTHVGMAPCALALTPDQRLLVVADRAASSLAILQADPTSLRNDRSVLITTIQVGASPVDVVVPDIINPQ